MSNSINKVTLLGRIGKEPEFRSFDNDRAVVQFSMATSENYKDKSGEWQEITTWHNIVGWNNLSAKVKKITDSGTQVKGMQVLVEGKIKNRSYDDKDGNKKYITEIEATSINIFGAPAAERNTASNERQWYPPAETTPVAASYNTTAGGGVAPQIEDDLPF